MHRRRLIGAALSLAAGATAANAAALESEAKSPYAKSGEAPTIEAVGPGIWRLRFGTPEALTPLSFRSAKVNAAGLNALPVSDTLPFDPTTIGFRVTGRGCSVTLPMTRDERIYGLGLSTQVFDKTDRRSFLRPTDYPENDLNDSHAPVPFFASSRGWGVYVDTARYAEAYAGNVAPMTTAANSDAEHHESATSTEVLYRNRMLREKTALVDIPSAHGVDVYVFGGPSLLDAVRRYNLFSGGGFLPPLWGLGILYRGKGDLSAAESLQLARSFRDAKILCDIWGVEPGWQTKTYSSSFVWNTAKFPDPAGFIGEMHNAGFRLSFWQHAFTHPTSPMYGDLGPASGDYRVWDGLVPDFATERARHIFQTYQEKILFGLGADAVKLDECDNQPSDAQPWSFPEASAFPSGLDGEQMHSLFGKLYAQTMEEPLRARNRRTFGLIRNFHALAAPLPYAVYSDSYDHRCYIRGLANAGFSGLLWVPEVRDATSVEDLLRRVQTVLFGPQAIINCWYMKLPPWLQIDRDRSNRGEMMPEHEAVTAAVRQLFLLRMSLIPYLYSAFNEYRLTGTPPIRALVMDWPEDAKTHGIDDQFLFGPSILVAPLVAGQKSRHVYLPSGGDWFDFYTGAKTAGGTTVEVMPPTEQIPLYVRGNCLLPLAAPVEHVTDDTRFELTVRAYGKSPVPFTLYEDDGISFDYEKGAQNQIVLMWSGGKGSVERKAGAYQGAERYRVIAWEAIVG